VIPGLDTSIVVRLLIGEPAKQAEAARRLLDERAAAREPPAALSDLVVGESYFALRHHYGVPHAKAVAALRALLNDPRVFSTGVARQVFALQPDEISAPGLIDRLIHGDYERAGAILLTFDRGAARLPGAKLLAS
jgi:predicted nucleic acid-binding protein